jgi:hypothetical protein
MNNKIDCRRNKSIRVRQRSDRGRACHRAGRSCRSQGGDERSGGEVSQKLEHALEQFENNLSINEVPKAESCIFQTLTSTGRHLQTDSW